MEGDVKDLKVTLLGTPASSFLASGRAATGFGPSGWLTPPFASLVLLRSAR